MSDVQPGTPPTPSPPPRPAKPATPSKRRADTGSAESASDGRRRALLVGVVGVALAAVLGAGVAYPDHGVPSVARVASETLLPTVDLSSTAATVWNCPGPLPVSGGSTSSISIVNPATQVADASVLIAETAVLSQEPNSRPTGEQLKSHSLDLRIGPQSEQDFTIVADALVSATTKATKQPVPTIDASVSVIVSGGGVAVGETVSSDAGTLARPCAVGSGTSGYTASGVTSGSSDVEVGLFDPSSSPAVVNVSIGTDSGLVQPEAFQGVTIAPMSLAVLDLGRFVPQRTRVALSVRAAVGRVVVGSLTTISARFQTRFVGPAHTYEETGEELVVGIGQPLTSWVMPLGPVGQTDSEAVRLFNPTARTAVVMIRTSAANAKPATLTVSVASGQSITVAIPVVSVPKANNKSAASTSTPGRTVITDGVVALRSTNGVGIVVEHETYVTSSKNHVTLTSSAPTAAPAATWVLPAMTQNASANIRISITDAGTRAVSVTVEQIYGAPISLAGSAEGVVLAPARLTTVEVNPGTSILVPLRTYAKLGTTAPFGIEIKASGPVLVTANLWPAKNIAAGAVEAGVPATSS
jgi:hypothetical protein